MTASAIVRAAGGVLWRDVRGGREIALVHRPRYDDWSIPKGKCKPGEPLLLTGAREVCEETGFVPHVRAPIGRYSYRLTGQLGPAVKTVRYWSMAAVSGAFLANEEVDELVWVGVAEAASTVSSLVDRKVLDAFAALPSSTATLLVGPSCRRSPKSLELLLDHLGVARLVSAAGSSNDPAFDRYAERTGLGLDTELGQELTAPTRHPSAPAVRRLLADVGEHRAAAVCIERAAAARLVADVALLCRRVAVPSDAELGWSLLHLHGDELLSIERGELPPMTATAFPATPSAACAVAQAAGGRTCAGAPSLASVRGCTSDHPWRSPATPSATCAAIDRSSAGAPSLASVEGAPVSPTAHVEIEVKYEAQDSLEMPLLIGVEGIEVVEEPVEEYLEATYYDTTDLALARAKVTLRRRTGGADEGWHLKLPRALNERLELHRPLGKSARVPPSLAELVAVHSKRARLAPVATLRTRRTVHRLFGKDGGPVAEVADDHVEGEAPGTAASAWREIEVESRGGDQALLARIGEQLEEAGAWPSDASSKLARVLAHRLGEPIDSDSPTDVADDVTAGDLVRRHLTDQVATLKDLDPLVRRDFPDAVHKMRVTVRRLRSALATYRRLLDKAVTEPLRDELKWLGRMLGDVRDAEVIHARLRQMIDGQRPSLIVGPVHRRLDRTIGGEHREAHRRCVTAMRSDRYYSLLDRLDDVAAGLAFDGKRVDKPADAAVPKEIGRSFDRLRKHVERAEALRTAGLDDEGDDVLHEVRKAAKRVRYGAESAEPVSGADAQATAGAMKELQEVLGDHQDTVVAGAVLRRLAADAHAAGEDTFTWGRLHAVEEQRRDRSRQRYRSIIDDAVAVPSWLR